MSSILFGDAMVPNIEHDYILLLGYSILYMEFNFFWVQPPKKHCSHGVAGAHKAWRLRNRTKRRRPDTLGFRVLGFRVGFGV